MPAGEERDWPGFQRVRPDFGCKENIPFGQRAVAEKKNQGAGTSTPAMSRGKKKTWNN